MKFKYSCIILCCFIVVLITSSCGDNKYSEFTKSFNESILKVAKSIQSNDSLVSLERIKLTENKAEIEKMERLLENIKDNVPSNMQPHYKEMQDLYNDCLALEKIAENTGQLSYDEISTLNIALINIDNKKDDLEGS